jgi:hypothetical protein
LLSRRVSNQHTRSRRPYFLWILELLTMRSVRKYLQIALALAAVATGGSTPLLAQSVYVSDVSTADRHFAVPVQWGRFDNYLSDDNPKGERGSYSPDDH